MPVSWRQYKSQGTNSAEAEMKEHGQQQKLHGKQKGVSEPGLKQDSDEFLKLRDFE
jgi:hypothetical protein